jgi:hypothetical protein
MPVLKIFVSTFSLLLVMFALPLHTWAQADTTGAAKPKKKPAIQAESKQLRIGVDLVKPALNLFNKNTKNYEVSADYYFKNELYFAAEAGLGSANVAYDDLSYKSTSQFLRVGVDKCMLQRLFPGDWDLVSVGFRYGIGFIKRGDASYTITDPIWGVSTGTVKAQNFTAHWAEFNAGIRVETFRNLFVGWNVRARFMLNAKQFEELSPSYISGYGKGDKSTAFDFNFYLSYALRWGKSKTATVNSGRKE